jgi:hypothetical protein
MHFVSSLVPIRDDFILSLAFWDIFAKRGAADRESENEP